MNKIVISTILLLVLDIIWIGGFIGGQYEGMIKKIQGSKMTVNLLYAVLTYILMIIGLQFFVISNVKEENLLIDSLQYGFLYGMILYGVYGLTAAAVIKDWDILVTVYDIIWGGTVYFLTPYLTFIILNYI